MRIFGTVLPFIGFKEIIHHRDYIPEDVKDVANMHISQVEGATGESVYAVRFKEFAIVWFGYGWWVTYSMGLLTVPSNDD